MYKRILLFILVLVLCRPPALSLAQGGLTMAVAGGFDGYARADAWIPIYVTLANEGADVDGQIQVSATDSWEDLVYVQPAVLPTHSNKQFTLYAFVPSGTQQVMVRLVQGGQSLAQEKVRVEVVSGPNPLYGIVSDDPSTLYHLAGLSTSGRLRVHVAHLGLADLPAQGRILSGIDVLILDNVDTSALDEDRRTALRGWAAAGGRLIVCGGPNAELTAAGLGELLPVSLQGSETTTDLAALGAYVGKPYDSQTPVVLTRVTPAAPNTSVLAGTAERPLLVRRTLDQGSIDYLALDPDLEPVRTWAGNEALWQKLLDGLPQAAGAIIAYNGSGIQQGVTNIPSLDIPSVLIVAGFLLLYVVVVGPVNLLVLKLADRRAWAWITIPILVVFFSGVAYAVGAISRGRSVIVSTASVIYTHNQSQTASVDSYVALYSPFRIARDVRLPDNVPTVHRIIYPSYMPGTFEISELQIEQGSSIYLRDLEVDVGAVRTFSMHTLQPWAGIESDLKLYSGGGKPFQIKGTITNLGEHTLTDCRIASGSQVFELPDILPSQQQAVDIPFYVSGSQSQSPTYVLAENLLDNPSTDGTEQREYERRRNFLSAVLEGSEIGSQPLSSLSSNLTLFAWIDESPLPVQVVGVANKKQNTTLLIAPLSYTSADAGGVVLPPRSFSWQQIDGPPASPYEIEYDQESRSYRFQLPSEASDVTMDQLFLHLDSEDTSSPVPIVSLWNVDGGAWQRVEHLTWGTNQLTDPQQFVDEQGAIQVRVTLVSGYATMSVDLSAIGHR